MTDWRRRDRLTVMRDGEEIEVFNCCSLIQDHTVRPTTQETWPPAIERCEAALIPEYVTEWLAHTLWHEYGVEVENYDIEAIDIESDEVTVL